MNLSESKEVQDFLEEILATDEEKSSILKELREMVFTNFEETNEKIMYGGIMFSKLNCNIKCIKNLKNLYRQRITQ